MNTVTRTVRKAMRKDSIQRQVLGHAATANWKFTRLVRTNGFHPDFTVANRRTLQSGYVTSSFSDTNTRTYEQVTKRHLLTELGSIRFYTLLGQDSYTNYYPVLTICFVKFEARKQQVSHGSVRNQLIPNISLRASTHAEYILSPGSLGGIERYDTWSENKTRRYSTTLRELSQSSSCCIQHYRLSQRIHTTALKDSERSCISVSLSN